MRSPESYEEKRRQLAEDRYGGICECGNHAWARLTRGYVVLVDAADADIIKEQAFAARISQGKVRAAHSVNKGGVSREICLHREILGTTRDRPNWNAMDQTEFKNGNGLDCRRENIQPCANTLFSGPPKHPAAPYKGVSMYKRASGKTRWHARVSRDCKNISLGYFPPTPEGAEAAAHAYDDAARNLFGEFAALNFPQPGERAARRAMS